MSHPFSHPLQICLFRVHAVQSMDCHSVAVQEVASEDCHSVLKAVLCLELWAIVLKALFCCALFAQQIFKITLEKTKYCCNGNFAHNIILVMSLQVKS